jgi:signal transduction histidine kinase
MIYFQRKDKNGEVIISNIGKIKLEGYDLREIPLKEGLLVIFTNNRLLVKNSKIFREVRDICAPVLDGIFNFINSDFIDKIKSHSHNLKKIQGQLIQKIESIVDSQEIIEAKDYESLKKIVSEKIKKNPDDAAETIIYARKRVVEIDAHISTFEILHMGKNIVPNFQFHNIRSLIIDISHAFNEQFSDLGMKVFYKFDDEIARANKIRLDYKIINSALYNFFDNAVKYAKPYSIIDIYFEIIKNNQFELKFSMNSLRIEKSELQDIFNLGYRSENAKDIDGSGVGMYVIKKALEINNLLIKVNPDYSKMDSHNNKQYIRNEFVIYNNHDFS